VGSFALYFVSLSQYLLNALEAESVSINMSFNTKRRFVLYSVL